MDGPLSIELGWGYGTEMLLAVFVGVGFGFFLERSGFGRANNLTSIFYGRDFRVMRVMFTAIVTAMIGLYFFDLFGIMPLASIGLLDTYLWPQLVGGALLGAGFIIGGYCPGTSLVGMVSGKIDAMLFVVGLFFGATIFSLSYADLASFHGAGAMGRVILNEFFGLPSGVMVVVVVIFALGAFYGVSKIEALVNRERSTS